MVNKILFQTNFININEMILSSQLSGNDNYRSCLILFTGEQMNQFSLFYFILELYFDYLKYFTKIK